MKYYRTEAPTRWRVFDICWAVAVALSTSEREQGRNPNQLSDCTIRCTINDEMDYKEKQGGIVPHDYSQKHAISKVRKLISQL